MSLIKALTKKDYGISGDKFGARPAWGDMARDAGPGMNYHIGVDYGTPSSTKLYAPADGVFLKTVRDGYGDGYGNYILFYIPEQNVTIHLAHLNHIEWYEGKGTVKKGTYIGNSGNTGLSSGPHLHVGVAPGKKYDTVKGRFNDGTWIDPLSFTLKESTSGKVKIKSSAKHYATGQAIPNFVKGVEYSVQEETSDRVLLREIQSWVYKSDIEGMSNAKYINIHPGKKYGTYKLGVQPVYKNIDQWLRPDNLGGLSYEIKDTTKYNDVYIIQTRDFGRRQIYLDKSRASITSSPLYKVYG